MKRPLITILFSAILSVVLSCVNNLLWFGNPDQLTTFKASDGDYFPEFVQKFFPSSVLFNQQYPRLNLAQSDLKLIEVKQLNTDPNRRNESNLSWSEDSAYLSFEVVEQNIRKIYLKNLIGNMSKELFMTPRGSNNFLDGLVPAHLHSYNSGLSWSKTSNQYAFMSNGGTGIYNIYLGGVGTKEKPITKSPAKEGYATWNPKKDEIAFVSSRTGNGDIYSITVASLLLTRLSFSDNVDLFPEWSPDGKNIIYSSGDGANHNLMIIKKLQSQWHKPQKLTSWEFDDLRPKVSPDGRFIAFYSNSLVNGTQKENNRWNIHIIPLITIKPFQKVQLEKTLIATDVVVDLNTGPAWSPDSRKIFYVKNDMQNFNPIHGYDLYIGRNYLLKTNTQMNRDILLSKLGILSFRAQVDSWDKVFVALTNQGLQLQNHKHIESRIHYLKLL